MRKHLTFTRRRFLGSLPAVAASIQIVPRHVLGGQGNLSPNEIPTKAVIGVGGMGRGHLKNVNPGSKLVAVCDVDRGHLKTALEQSGPDVKGYSDFREVLARKDVDIVHIPTPPHWHALISIAAAEAGKDIWCEKPMTRTIYEGEKVVEAVQRNKRIFRLNTWFRFQSGFYGMGTEVKPIKKLVESGLLGWPLKVTLNQATGFNWKHNWSGRTDLTPQPVPEELDYDFWLGPAPFKPYHPHRVHSTFRGYWDYDGGGLGDMGQHYIDPTQYLLGKDNESPVEIEADTDPQDDDAVTAWRWIRDAEPVGFFKAFGGFTGHVDRWHYYHLHLPCIAVIDFGSAPTHWQIAEADRQRGVRILALHLLTPVDETHTIDRWLHIRNTAIDDPEAGARMDALFRTAFAEDKAILEAIQAEELRPQTRRPIRIAIDRGPLVYRKRIAERIEQERTLDAGGAPSGAFVYHD